MKMCVWFGGYPVITCFQRFALFQLIFVLLCHDDKGSSWQQLLLQFYKQAFLKLFKCFYGLKMCMCFWGYPPIISYQLFRRCFSCLISIRMIHYRHNSSYSFPIIIFKLCVLVLYDLKMCVWFWGYPPSIVYLLFPLF